MILFISFSGRHETGFLHPSEPLQQPPTPSHQPLKTNGYHARNSDDTSLNFERDVVSVFVRKILFRDQFLRTTFSLLHRMFAHFSVSDLYRDLI